MKTPVRTLLLASALTLAAVSARAQTPTVITSLPYTITAKGTYVLNSDLGSSQTDGALITVGASNVTLDFQGHYISGPAGNTSQTTYGVRADNKSNVTVRNGTIAYCYTGIYLVGSTPTPPTPNSVGHQVDNMRLTYCYYNGIFVGYSPASRVTNCQVSQTGFSGASSAFGILVFGAGTTVSNNLISTVTASTNNYGIELNGADFARQNTVYNATTGVYGGKYQDNLTFNCTTPVSGGTDAGGNN